MAVPGGPCRSGGSRRSGSSRRCSSLICASPNTTYSIRTCSTLLAFAAIKLTADAIEPTIAAGKGLAIAVLSYFTIARDSFD